MLLATCWGLAVNKPGVFIPAIIFVLINPGFTVTTYTELLTNLFRNPDKYAVKPALALP